MLKLKEVLAGVSKTQADLARAVDLSPAAIAQLINHGLWPKSLNQQQLAWRITEYLMGHGAQFDDVRQAFEEVEPRRANAEAPATPENVQENEECDPMVMNKQVLLPATKKAFDIRRDPFEELQSADDMYVSPDIRYVREAMYHVARHDGFLAVVGESGAGKSTLRRDLVHRLNTENAPVIPIEPYVLAMEDSDTKGKTLRVTHIAEAMMAAVAPLERPKSSPEARFAQLHRALKVSHAAGFKHVLIIEEAHSLPIATLKHLKRLRELEDGFTKLVSIILIGQPELGTKLSPRNGDVREVVQRIEIVEQVDPGCCRGKAPGVPLRPGWQAVVRRGGRKRHPGADRAPEHQRPRQDEPALPAGHRQHDDRGDESGGACRRTARHCRCDQGV